MCRRGSELLRLSSHGAVKILVDSRPALRERTGVGEYLHEIIRAYTLAHDDAASFTNPIWNPLHANRD